MSERIENMIWEPSPEEMQHEVQWIKDEIQTIGPDVLIDLGKTSSEIRKRAYQPYSEYSVGVSILTVSGAVYSSVNAETVTYTETDHAERSAITKAISEGEVERNGRKFLRALAVSHSGESAPCGGCRQRMAEHADNCIVMDVDPDGKIQSITSLKQLLPKAFTPTHLGIK